MTREEQDNAIKVLRNFDLNNPKVNLLLFSAEEITNAFEMAIKALEQEPILDKIRAEIKEAQTYKMFEGEDTVYVERNDVLAIIDKCKAEKE